jgi:hypothetical protein
MTEQLKATDFARHLNTKFLVSSADSRPFEFELVEINEGIVSPVQEAFALVFRAPVDAPQVPRLYTLQHDQMGTLTLALSPIKIDHAGLYYEAVFNRVVKKE